PARPSRWRACDMPSPGGRRPGSRRCGPWRYGCKWRLTCAYRPYTIIYASRTCHGEHVAAELAAGLAERDAAVVSGGAYGIDGAAHRAALAADGFTVAVLAGGIDVPYPTGHAALFHRIAEQGLLVTEYPPGVRPARHRFLTRNRLVAALSRATVVVEAGARSGAANTAAWARA